MDVIRVDQNHFALIQNGVRHSCAQMLFLQATFLLKIKHPLVFLKFLLKGF